MNKKIYRVLIGLLFLFILFVLNHTYRPYIYMHGINDFHVADTLGSLLAVPALLFILSGIRRENVKTIEMIPVAVLALVIMESSDRFSLFNKTYDLNDIIASIISGLITYVVLRCLSIKELWVYALLVNFGDAKKATPTSNLRQPSSCNIFNPYFFAWG